MNYKKAMNFFFKNDFCQDDIDDPCEGFENFRSLSGKYKQMNRKKVLKRLIQFKTENR